MRSYRSSSHTVHDLRVHLIWITKYRYKVLTKEVGVRTREIIRQACDQNGIQMLADGFLTRVGRRAAYIHRDRINGRLRGRKGARLTAITNGGVIPDQFDYDVL